MKLYDAIDTHRQLYLILESCKGKMLSDIVKMKPHKTLEEDTVAKISY